MVKKLSLDAFLSADSLIKESSPFTVSTHDSLNYKIKHLFLVLEKHSSIFINEKRYINNITSANNLYFYSLNEETGEIINECMILMENIIDIKNIDPITYKIVNEYADKSITIRIDNE